MQPGTTLRNRYQIIKLLGEGGFGQTFLAEDLGIPIDPKPRCVVKRLKTANLKAEELEWLKNAFAKEAATLYNLGRLHPQIPGLSEYFQVGNEFYLVQDFIDGVELTNILTPGKKIPEVAVIQLLTEILEVLAVVHQENIIHRDIKPQNIMRRHVDGRIILIDFGAVKQIMFKNSGQTSLTVGIGTPGFMPVEQIIGKPKLASDIYAVGMIGIQALTGVTPHELDDDEDGEAIWQDKVNISSGFAEVLTRMVNSRASQRYQNAAEALEAMQFLNQPIVPTVILPPTPLEENEENRNSEPLQQTILPSSKTFSSSIQGFFNSFKNTFTAQLLGKASYDYRVIRINHHYAITYHNRGLSRYNLGEYQAAIEDYDQAIKLNPDYAIAYHNRGIARRNLGEHQAAIEDYNQAIKLNPDYAIAYHNRGIARRNLGEHQAAIEDYNQAIKLNPDYAIAYHNRGIARRNLGEYQAAIEDYNQAIKLNPDYAIAYNNRGNARGDLGEYQAAIQDYNQAIKLNPDYANAYHNRGFIRSNLGDYQVAIEDYRQAANLYKEQGKESDYQDALDRIKGLEK
ncbi:tetratricopeptide repeat protein [Brunnivagina elsteri]|uniref:serine/threonine-protein kinase n=1 Tax=Brunnivagina elsteri TaxID=1247191 RepID=UPI001303FCA1|nr:serine/threonine-protein kinase [Calothrix elsteri]